MDTIDDVDPFAGEAAGYDPAQDFDDASAAIDPAVSVADLVEAQQRGDELATRYAVLAAVGAGVKNIQGVVTAELVAHYREHGMVKGTHRTVLGSVAMRENKGKTSIVIDDEVAFTEHMAVTDPDSVETIARVKDDYRTAALEIRFAVADGKVVDTTTGAVVPFASVKETPAGDPVPAYSAGPEQQAAKMRATEWVDEQMQRMSMAIGGGEKPAIEAASH